MEHLRCNRGVLVGRVMGKGIRAAKTLNRSQPFTTKARGSVRSVKERLRLETMNGLRAMGAPMARASLYAVSSFL